MSFSTRIGLLLALWPAAAISLCGQLTPEIEYSGSGMIRHHVIENDDIIYSASYYGQGNCHIELYNQQFQLIADVDCNSFPFISGPNGIVYGFSVFYVQRHLFDTDNEIEFLLFANSGMEYITLLVKEDGTLLQVFENSYLPLLSQGIWPRPIFNSNEGAKMAMVHAIPGSGIPQVTQIYPLPGYLWVPCCTSEGGNLVSRPSDRTFKRHLYPNPTGGIVTIPYDLAEGITRAELLITDDRGRIVKTIRVGKAFQQVELDLSHLPAGSYQCSLICDGVVSETQRILVVKQ